MNKEYRTYLYDTEEEKILHAGKMAVTELTPVVGINNWRVKRTGTIQPAERKILQSQGMDIKNKKFITIVEIDR